MIRDLIYPEDARKIYNNLIQELEYDAAFALLGNSAGALPLPGTLLNQNFGIKFGNQKADRAVRIDAPELFSRFALISMITHIEKFNRLILLQRFVLEELKEGNRMTPEPMWNILKRVAKEIREKSATDVVIKLIVKNPSPDLQKTANWLADLTKVRNCLVHRDGIVQIDDVKERGAPLEQVKDSDTLKAHWLRVKVSEAGKEITKFPYTVNRETKLDTFFESYERKWKIGEIIHITPVECQGMAMSLSFLGKQILAEFEKELNIVLKINKVLNKK